MLLAGGCSNGLATLEGVVTIDGVPAPASLAIEFAATASGTSAYGQTDETGRYEAAATFQQKGIPPGRYRVRLLPGAGPSTGQRPPRGLGGSRQTSPDAMKKYPQAWYREIEQINLVVGLNRHDINLVLPVNEDKPGTLRPAEPQSQKPAVTPAGQPPSG